MTPKHSFLITGASSDLGRRLIQLLCEDPMVNVFSTSRAESEYISATPNHFHLGQIDLVDPDDLGRLEAALVKRFTGQFHVVNCVGHFPGYLPLCGTDVLTARRVFEENVLALHGVATVTLPLMGTRGGGHFIAFSSHAVSQAFPLMATFNSAKAAVEVLIRSIANEHSKDKIVATALAVATLDTPHEREMRPHANYGNWLQPQQIYDLIRRLVEFPFSIMNGNTIHLFNFSEEYFGKSYFDRLGLADQ